ncbi:MAG: hypothetical protein ACRDWV_06730 [Acidimicrobiales bacterium]
MDESLDFFPARLRVGRWREFRSSDFVDFGADAVLIALPKPLAGLGTRRQMDGIALGLTERMGGSFPLGYVGPAIPDGPQLLREPTVVVPATEAPAATYRGCEAAFAEAFVKLAEKGCRRPLVVAMGYTAFGPEGARRAFESTRQFGLESIMVLVVDSAFPDRDIPETEVDEEGWPRGRFYEPAYQCTELVTVAFLLTSSYEYDPRVLVDRRPDDCPVAVIAPPYTSAYVAELARAAQNGREHGPSALDFLGIQSWGSRDLLIPFVSSDIWTPSAVGAWMREAEYDTVVRGTQMIVDGLALLARDRGSRIVMPIDPGVREVIDISSHSRVNGDGAGLVLLPYSELPQSDHARMLGASDLAISRTGAQANSSVVLAVAEVPSVVVDLPAAGYMQAELCSAHVEYDISIATDGQVGTTRRSRPLAWFARWDSTPRRFAMLVAAALSRDEAHARATASRQALDTLRGEPYHDLFSIISALTAIGRVG